MAKGYTKLSNKIFDFLCSDALDHSELKVMLFLIRFTVGFNRDTTRASISYIARGTCLCENTVRKSLKKLVNKGYVEIEYEHSGQRAQILKVILQKIEGVLPQSLSPYTTKDCRVNTTKDCTQDIKEDITDKDIKEKERASLPSHLIGIDPDDMTDEQFAEWIDWRDGNGDL